MVVDGRQKRTMSSLSFLIRAPLERKRKASTRWCCPVRGLTQAQKAERRARRTESAKRAARLSRLLLDEADQLLRDAGENPRAVGWSA